MANNLGNYKFTTQLTEALYNDQLERIEGLKDPPGKLYYLKISQGTFDLCKANSKTDTRAKNGDKLRGYFFMKKNFLFNVDELVRNYNWHEAQFSGYKLDSQVIIKFLGILTAFFGMRDSHLFGAIFIFTRKKILLFPVVEDPKLPLAKAKICRIDRPEKAIIHNVLYCEQQ